MRFGCCTGVDNIEVVQNCGYDYVELGVGTVIPESPDTEFEPIRDRIMAFDILPEAWNGMLPGDLKVVGPEVDNYRIERYLRTAFERIEELGGEIVVFGSGKAREVPDGFPQDEAEEQLVDFLTLAGRIAGTHGITIAIEPLNKGETNIINSVKEGIEVMRRVSHPFVKVLADLYHMQVENESLDILFEANGDLAHVHTADTGRMQPGSGNYPNKEMIEILKKIGYEGRVSAESCWGDFKAQCGEVLEFLRSLS
ncbi:MAG: sugar phosphate isomerase/epimerase family protein [Armatimonadota bacterium]|nr:sugar phosphate isomerase/epimerase [bacterium]